MIQDGGQNRVEIKELERASRWNDRQLAIGDVHGADRDVGANDSGRIDAHMVPNESRG
jgi:hypothetical protein